MSHLSIVTAFGFVLLIAAEAALPQATIRSLQPRSCRPGETIQLTVTGENLDAGLRVVTSDRRAEAHVEAAEAEKARIELSLSDDCPLGPLGVWVATEDGPADPFVLMVDDLPSIAQSEDNHSPESGQKIPVLTAVDGVSSGAKSDYYRFEVTEGQRVAFEILTQSLNSTMDPVLRLTDETGKTLRVADDDNVGPECRFQHRFSSGGEYLLEVRDSRFLAGGHYHLRVGDFPVLQHAYPLTVAPGERTLIQFAGDDDAEDREIEFPSESLERTVPVSTRLPEGQSLAWVPIRLSELPQFVEGRSSGDDAAGSDEPLAPPIAISGVLSETDQRDEYAIRGVKDRLVRIRSRTRSLNCGTLLRMRLINAAGEQVAETAVSDSDEWSFDYTFPDDETYRLRVEDLLGRGGDGFGYCIEVVPEGTFSLSVKADAKVNQQFAVEAGHGACAIDLQVQRFGYEGEIELDLLGENDGLKIVNPRIAAGTKEARVYLAADDEWSPDSISTIRLRGRASADPALQSEATTLAWQRAKTPHVPFPSGWRDGVILLSGAAATEPPFALESDEPARFARPLQRHSMTLKLRRTEETFESGVAILPDALPAGWEMETEAKGDRYDATFTRTGEAIAEPGQMKLLVFAEHQGRGRMEIVNLPLEWFDPLTVRLESAEPLVAGGRTAMVAMLDRQGKDPQPVDLQLSDLPAGIRGPEKLTLAADQDRVEFEIETAADAISREETVLGLAATSSYLGERLHVVADSLPLSLIPIPVSLEVTPREIRLHRSGDRRQFVVTGYDDSATPRDWTRDARLTSADPQVAEIRGTAVFAKADGETEITVELGKHRQSIPVRVVGTETEPRTAFESEVLVALSKQGCNSGACHGSPSGKGMFRLSLRAFDRELDEFTLTREDFGRRVNPIDPEQSLLLLKPMMQVSHGGGKQLRQDDAAYAIFRDWIAEGAQVDPPSVARCVRLEVLPNEKRVLRLEGGGTQQLAAVAHFSDGSSRDVTHLVAYESSRPDVGTVDDNGLVTPLARGETVILVRYLEHIESVPLMFTKQVPGFTWQDPPANNYIDELVNAKLKKLQYVPSDTCTDAEFLRRVYLDVIGILPSVAESRAFLDDPSPDKRSRLIDQLIEREEFAKFWSLKWGDLLRMTKKRLGEKGVHKYHRWIEESIRNNIPYDEFAHQLVAARGSTLANPPANFYRAASDMNLSVETVSQVFLGVRLQCAKCHNHPFERWTQDNYYGLSAFFHRVERRRTERPEEMFIWTSGSGEVTQPRTGEQMEPWLPGLGTVKIDDEAFRRGRFADWLVEPENPFFAKMEVNRIWAQLFARGIVEPIDDSRDSNPPSNPALLDALTQDFVANDFDRQHLLRRILNSRTYQASYRTESLNRDDRLYFSHQRPRLLSAEQLFDALNQVLGLKQRIGELPAGMKATQLPAPDLVQVEFLKVFGQSGRSTACACERTDDSSLGMAIELFNGPMIYEKLRDPQNRFRRGVAAGKPVQEVLTELYFAALCRPPSEVELRAAVDHCEQREDVAAGLEDICWALFNTDEFLFQH